jgi:hypothetical protein
MTWKGCYQALVFLLLVVFPLWSFVGIVAVRHAAATSSTADSALTAIQPVKLFFLCIGLLLQPIAAVGLWNDKVWGALLLLVAIALGAFALPAGSVWAVVMLALATVRLVAVKRRLKKADKTHPLA